MCSTSAATTPGCASRSGFAAIDELSPTAGPPYTIALAIFSSVTERCHLRSRKSTGFGFRFAATGPLPSPFRPWHTAHLSPNNDAAVVRAPSAMACAPLEATLVTPCGELVCARAPSRLITLVTVEITSPMISHLESQSMSFGEYFGASWRGNPRSAFVIGLRSAPRGSGNMVREKNATGDPPRGLQR